MRFIVIALLLSACLVHAGPKRIAVFVALCDNASQGIAPVPAKIGNGDKPADNLYWGCDDGLSSCFRASKSWKLVRKDAPNDHRILERLVFQSTDGTMELVAEAWRGKEIGSCMKAFENALISGQHDLCAYIGHNVLMDYAITPPATKATQPCDAIVLCCKSEPYFKTRLEGLGAKPVLLTTQFMYPGSFLLRDTLPAWAKGKPIRALAGASYARNQKISAKAATGVFANLPQG